MNGRDFQEEEWIAKYRAAMDAFSQEEESSWSIRKWLTQLRTYCRRAFPPNIQRLKPARVTDHSSSSARGERQPRKNGTFS